MPCQGTHADRSREGCGIPLDISVLLNVSRPDASSFHTNSFWTAGAMSEWLHPDFEQLQLQLMYSSKDKERCPKITQSRVTLGGTLLQGVLKISFNRAERELQETLKNGKRFLSVLNLIYTN